jgi:hypothetical protein
MKDNYEDIINLPHFEPKNHPRMSRYNRAGQFAPFAALTGYEEEVKETSRLTNKKIEMDEGLKSILNYKLQIINKYLVDKPLVTITFFVADKKKSGGKYQTITDNILKIDIINKFVILKNKKKIALADILTISSDILNNFDNLS